MDTFLNVIKAHAAALDQGVGQARLGVVSSVNPDTYTARVLLQPEGVLSGWLPVAGQWTGAGWGMTCPPSPGEQVVVLAQEGDSEHGIIVGRLWSDARQAPATPCGELWLTHASGSFLRLLNDGSISGSAARWDLAGDLHVAGQVIASGDVSAGSVSLQEHVHGGVQSGGASTTRPVA